MGMSLSADVFWGFDLGYGEDIDDNQMPLWWQDGENWEEVLAGRLGWVDVPFPKELAPAALDDWRIPAAEPDRLRQELRATPEYRAWSANRDQLRELVKSIGVEIDLYGYEYDARSVRIKASVQSCDSGAQPLKPLDVSPDWADQLARFCELLEIPIPETGPDWHLCATWA
ncbi:hypothetical protein [Nocardia otitidiscaviarum]|uniref:hypothetical protein n=1 Tax=Nocardia otitidiscaviarum TaxID=1823 RepID=UPI0004A75338|nr:hypothetical protein [Nocardia otitidiscaviarum]